MNFLLRTIIALSLSGLGLIMFAGPTQSKLNAATAATAGKQKEETKRVLECCTLQKKLADIQQTTGLLYDLAVVVSQYVPSWFQKNVFTSNKGPVTRLVALSDRHVISTHLGSPHARIVPWDLKFQVAARRFLAHPTGNTMVRLSDTEFALSSGANLWIQNVVDSTKGQEIDVSIGWISALAALPGDRLAYGTDDGKVMIFDTKTEKAIQEFQIVGTNCPIRQLVFTSQRDLLACNEYGFNRTRMFDLKTLKEKWERPSLGDTRHTCLLSDGTILFVDAKKHCKKGSHKTIIYKRDPYHPTGGVSIKRRFLVKDKYKLNLDKEIFCVQPLPHARAALATEDGPILIYDSDELEIVATLKGHTKGATALTLQSDGTELVSSSDDGTIIVWDLVANTIKQRLTPYFENQSSADQKLAAEGDVKAAQGEQKKITALASVSDVQVASGDDRGNIVIWEREI